MSVHSPMPAVRPRPAWWPHTEVGRRLGLPRRALTVALALIWLLDAALQFQPYMFTKAFVTQIIDPTISGNPYWIASSERWAAGMMSHHIVVYNTAFALIQLLIALAIFWPRTTRIGLAASIVWALGVWWFGEGLGGIFTGASPLGGLPGGVILYALIALLIWPTGKERSADSVATSGPLGPHVPRVAWLVLWGSFVYFLILPANRTASGLHDTLASMAEGEPGWLAAFDRDAASVLSGIGLEVSIVIAVACALVAVSVFVPALVRAGVGLAVVLAVAFWLAEDFRDSSGLCGSLSGEGGGQGRPEADAVDP